MIWNTASSLIANNAKGPGNTRFDVDLLIRTDRGLRIIQCPALNAVDMGKAACTMSMRISMNRLRTWPKIIPSIVQSQYRLEKAPNYPAILLNMGNTNHDNT